MSVYLIGGGWDKEASSLVYGPFLEAAAAAAGHRAADRAAESAVVACLLVDEGDGHGAESFTRFDAALRSVAPCTPVPVLVPLGRTFDPASLENADALLVCGGLTPAYQECLAPALAELPDVLRTRGMPYAGFSAGAAVASRAALVGGWLSDGTAVCPEDAAEDLDELAVRPGLGLLPWTVDVHATQWGTLARLMEAVRRGDVPKGVAIDENTLLTVDGGRARVSGLGRAHVVGAADPGAGEAVAVTVRAYRSGESFGL